MQYALLGALITGLAAPALGTYLVQRRLALIGDGIGHVALTGVAVGLLTASSPVLTAMLVAAAGAVAIELVRARGRTSGDVALAVLFYGGIAGGVFLVSLSAGNTTANLNAYLFGSPLTTSRTDLLAMAVLGGLVLAVTLGLRPWLFAVCHDEEYARVSGLPVRALEPAARDHHRGHGHGGDAGGGAAAGQRPDGGAGGDRAAGGPGVPLHPATGDADRAGGRRRRGGDRRRVRHRSRRHHRAAGDRGVRWSPRLARLWRRRRRPGAGAATGARSEPPEVVLVAVERDQAVTVGDVNGQEAYEAAGELLRALAAPVRVAIVTELANGHRCVHELVDALGVAQPLVSQHLRVLRGAGVVRGSRRGREIAYSLVDEHVAHIVADAISHAGETRPRESPVPQRAAAPEVPRRPTRALAQSRSTPPRR